MHTFRQFIRESRIISPSTEPNTLTLWHGGNLDSPPPKTGRSGRAEYGPGLYLTTHYTTATNYAKGSRKLYQVVIRKGTDIQDATVSATEATAIVKRLAIGRLQKEILERLTRHGATVPVNAVVTLLINLDAVKTSNQDLLREWLVEQGVDYTIVNNIFGTHQLAVVVHNPDVIMSKTRILPTDKISQFDLTNNFV